VIKRARWSEKEDQILNDHFGSGGAEYCSLLIAKLGIKRSPRSCLWRAYKLGLHRGHQYRFEGEAVDIRVAAELAGISYNTVYARLRAGFPSLDLALYLPKGIRLDAVERIIQSRYVDVATMTKIRELGITPMQLKLWATTRKTTKR